VLGFYIVVVAYRLREFFAKLGVQSCEASSGACVACTALPAVRDMTPREETSRGR
jgi:hypothetical protein